MAQPSILWYTRGSRPLLYSTLLACLHRPVLCASLLQHLEIDNVSFGTAGVVHIGIQTAIKEGICQCALEHKTSVPWR
jgi:hypothetical protein